MNNVKHNEAEIVKELSLPLFRLMLRRDKIVVVTMKDNLFLTISDAKTFTRVLNYFVRGEPHRVLVIPGRKTTADKEFRSYMASEEAQKNIIAEAVVAVAIPQRIIADLFLSMDMPRRPVRFFDNVAKAIEWLKTQN